MNDEIFIAWGMKEILEFNKNNKEYEILFNPKKIQFEIHKKEDK